MDVAFSSYKPKKKAKPSLLPALLLLPAVATVSWLAFSHSSLLLYSFYEPPVAKTLSGGEEPNAFPASSSSSPVWQRPLHVSPTRLNSTRANANSSAEEAMLQKADDRVRSSELQDPYHNWELFRMDFEEMLQNLKIFVYPDVRNKSASFSSVFLPHPNPFDPKLGNYFSEHMFKISLIQSSFLTSNPADALFFFMPFSVNVMRNDRRVHSEASIAEFVAQYTLKISREFEFWNASRGSDHFYVCCHSIGREAASKHRQLFNNAIQLSCSSSYFQRLYVAHKDAGLPQIWPRPPEKVLNPPHARKRLVFFCWAC